MQKLATRATKVAHGLASPLGRRALRSGVGAAIEHLRILGEPWQVVVDIGANRGQFALAALNVHPQTIIHSFEPLAGPGQYLETFFADLSNVHVHRVAIGAEAGEQLINVSAHDDSSSLLPIGSEQVAIFPGTAAVGTEKVYVCRLEDRISHSDLLAPSLLKIDVQGYELEVLQGCETLLPYFSAVYVECSFVELYRGQALFGEVVTWLHGRGFNLADMGPVFRDKGRAIQGDFLFRRAGPPPAN